MRALGRQQRTLGNSTVHNVVDIENDYIVKDSILEMIIDIGDNSDYDREDEQDFMEEDDRHSSVY